MYWRKAVQIWIEQPCREEFDGQRNIYTYYMLLGILLGRPFYALVVMALHAFLTGAVYAARAARHLHAADVGRG